MATFEDLRLIDLVERFLKSVEELADTKNLSLMKETGKRLQGVYDFFITSESGYEAQQEMLKNTFSAFNYAAVIVNAALKKGKLKPEDGELLNECLQIMLKCGNDVVNSLKQK